MDNIEYGIYTIPDKNEAPPTRACCICDEYKNKKARIAYVGGWICPECKRRLRNLLYPNCGATMGNLTKAEHDKEQREYEAAIKAAQYCEMYEPTYDPETGAM